MIGVRFQLKQEGRMLQEIILRNTFKLLPLAMVLGKVNPRNRKGYGRSQSQHPALCVSPQGADLDVGLSSVRWRRDLASRTRRTPWCSPCCSYLWIPRSQLALLVPAPPANIPVHREGPSSTAVLWFSLQWPPHTDTHCWGHYHYPAALQNTIQASHTLITVSRCSALPSRPLILGIPEL